MTAVFPSLEHRAELAERRKQPGGLSGAERAEYHSYAYGFRRAVLGNFAATSPIDADGNWYRPNLIAEAEAMYRRKFARPKTKATLFDPPANAGAEQVETWEYQRRELARLRAKITGNGKLADGSHAPDAIAFVELACHFARANLEGFVSGNTHRAAATDAELAAIQAGLGITATDQPQEAELGKDAA